MSRSTFIMTALASVALIASVTYALSLRRQGSAPASLVERVQKVPSFDPPPPPPEVPAETEITVSAVQIVGRASAPKAPRLDCGDWQSLAQGPATQHVRNCTNVYR
jgi:hypothetical protein